jgi:hypothetical protein
MSNTDATKSKKLGIIVKRFAGNILYPSLLWAILFGSCYLSIGIVIFPAWWKRALFEHAIFQIKFLSFAIHFLVDLFLLGHPLGIALIIGVIVTIGYLIYLLGSASRGRESFRIPSPRKRSLLVSILFMCGMVISLRFVGGNYRTPEEMQDYANNLRNEAEDPFINMQRATIKGPASGYFFYLDSQKVSQIFNYVRESFRLASETSTTTTEKSGAVGIEADGIKIEWKREKVGQDFNVEVIPLAVW